MFPPGCAKLLIKPDPTGSRTSAITMGMADVARRVSSTVLDDHVDFAFDEVRHQFRNAIVIAIGEMPFDHHIPSLEISRVP
jgi:hypothetical protein